MWSGATRGLSLLVLFSAWEWRTKSNVYCSLTQNRSQIIISLLKEHHVKSLQLVGIKYETRIIACLTRHTNIQSVWDTAIPSPEQPMEMLVMKPFVVAVSRIWPKLKLWFWNVQMVNLVVLSLPSSKHVAVDSTSALHNQTKAPWKK